MTTKNYETDFAITIRWKDKFKVSLITRECPSVAVVVTYNTF
jgi:hypothetical protein